MAEKTRTIKINAEIPQGEYEILVHYSKGASIRQLASEKNTKQEIIIALIRRNLRRLLASDKLISNRCTSKGSP